MFFLNSLVSSVVGVLAIVLGVCLKWAILPPVVDSMVRCDNSIYSNAGNNDWTKLFKSTKEVVNLELSYVLKTALHRFIASLHFLQGQS